MLCANCKKNQATKSYESIKKGKQTIEYVCLDCYEHLLQAAYVQEMHKDTCPYCGTTAEILKKRNLVGCAKCYQTLHEITDRMVEKMQGNVPHCGKKPTGGELERIARRCDELKLMIDKFNREKDFEQSRAYTERLMRLQAGEAEENYVWQKHLNLSRK